MSASNPFLGISSHLPSSPLPYHCQIKSKHHPFPSPLKILYSSNDQGYIMLASEQSQCGLHIVHLIKHELIFSGPWVWVILVIKGLLGILNQKRLIVLYFPTPNILRGPTLNCWGGSHNSSLCFCLLSRRDASIV